MTTWTLRPAVPEDYARLAEIVTLVSTAPYSAAEVARQDEQRAKSGPFMRLVGVGEGGVVAGTGRLHVDAWRAEGTYLIAVEVDPAFARQGLGERLHAALHAEAARLGARVLGSGVRDDQPEWLAWAKRRGYRVMDQYFKSELKLAGFDPAPFLAAVDRAESAGYRFFTLADVDAEVGKRRLYETDMDAARDEPGIDQTTWPPISFAEYCTQMFDTPLFDPRAVVIAAKGEDWAGLSGLHYRAETNSGWVFFTGVRREHRGRGLAQALKLLSVEFARGRGWEKIGTSNNARNPAMLAVNRKFGFVPQPGYYILEKAL